MLPQDHRLSITERNDSDSDIATLQELQTELLELKGIAERQANELSEAKHHCAELQQRIDELEEVNGNLVVAGEKQVGINQNIESLKFAGVVSPMTIQAGNVVSSTQVADARMQVRGKGDIDRAQTTGWLSRFFLSFLPI